MNELTLQQTIEAALMVTESPLSIMQLQKLFEDNTVPEKHTILKAIEALQAACGDRGVELKQIASGYRYQAKQEFAPILQKLWEERPPKYSRALLETLVLIAYRQPITRAEIEEVRGVAVSSSIVKTLLEREWVKIVGHRDVPGKPALLGTTRLFLDYFNLKSLSELPPLPEVQDLDAKGIEVEEQLVEALEHHVVEEAEPEEVPQGSTPDLALEEDIS